MSLDNALKFEALMCAAAEVLPYAKETFIEASMESIKHLPRDKRRQEERDFRKSFSELQKILNKFSTVVEHDNKVFFDRVVYTLVETVNNTEVIKW